MPLPNPTNAWKLVKYGLRAAEYAVPAGVAWLSDLLDDEATASDIAWVRVVMEYTREAPSGVGEDKAQFKFDMINVTGGTLDTSWTSGDVADVLTHVGTLATSLAPEIQSVADHTATKMYAMSFNPSDPGPGNRGPGAGAFLETGPPFVNDTGGHASSGAGVMPYQVATSVTLKTAWPRHWGRVYIPNPWHSGGLVDVKGRLVAAHRTAVADAVHDFITALADDDFLVVVPVTQLQNGGPGAGSVAFHALLGVNEVVVDDVPDVQRRRRPKQVAARTVGA